MDTATRYWDDEWARRDNGDYTECNGEKFKFIHNKLKNGTEFIAPLRTLEIGCGSCLHIKTLAVGNPIWKEKYTGIDMSENAVNIAKRWNINAEVGSIYDFKSDTKFQLFLFFDVLEHIEDHEKTAAQIKRLAADRYCIIGNVPLYLSHVEDDGYEREMNIAILRKFLNMAGTKQLAHIVYDIKGWPYMWFEAQ